MDETGTETLLEFPIDVGEGSITTYEAARVFHVHPQRCFQGRFHTDLPYSKRFDGPRQPLEV